MKAYAIIRVKHGMHVGQIKLISHREYDKVIYEVLSEADDLDTARNDFERVNKIGVPVFVVEQLAKEITK